jgi:general secretion pathway protein E
METLNDQELLSMEDAIARLKTTRPTFYRWLRSGRIQGLKVGRQWRFYAADLDRFLKGEGPRVDTPVDIAPLAAQIGQLLGDTSLAAGLAGVAQGLLRLALAHQASDLHLEPLYTDQDAHQAVVRLRVEGMLQPSLYFDRRLLPSLLAHFKHLAACDPHSQSPQDGQWVMEGEVPSEWRAHFLPSLLGESLTLRYLPPKAPGVTLAQLHLPESILQALDKSLKQGWGLIVTSGPTGSGKTTTLHAALQEVAAPSCKTFALEDPAERYFPWVIPVQNPPETSFSQTLRQLMQADPDVLMIGELRDPETVDLALRIALTGHLVLTQLHAESAVKALLRLIDTSDSVYTVTESVKLVLNQRLVRRLCPACKVWEPLSADQQAAFAPFLTRWQIAPTQPLPQAKGCPACAQQGYRGRLQITEALPMTGALRQLLHQHPSAEAIDAHLQAQQWPTYLDDGWERVQAGETTLEELARVASF